MRELTVSERSRVSAAISRGMAELKAKTPEEKKEVVSNVIDIRTRMRPDGASAETGVLYTDDTEDEQLNQTLEASQNLTEVGDAVQTRIHRDLYQEHQILTPEERAPVTRPDVQKNIPSTRVGPDAFAWLADMLKKGGWFQETPETKEAKSRAAQSTRTDVKPEVEQVVYDSNSCTSQGETIKYKVAFQRVDWAECIKAADMSTDEAMQALTAFVTTLVRKTYGGWHRITEIIVRDQHLIINRSCVQPMIDRSVVDIKTFPIDVVDYIREGAVAGLFDWKQLKNMSNLRVLDVDDLGFYEINIGGRLKCGRRIGVSTIFNYVKSLDVLILGGDAVTREGLTSDDGVKVKKKLATHKRFTLFSDGFKLNVCQNTNDLSSWTMNNLKSYATNRGNKGFFRYSCGVIARGAMAGVTGVLNIGTHLVGGIVNTIKSAMTPVDPEEVGLK